MGRLITIEEILPMAVAHQQRPMVICINHVRDEWLVEIKGSSTSASIVVGRNPLLADAINDAGQELKRLVAREIEETDKRVSLLREVSK